MDVAYPSDVTLVEDAIHNPDEPRHFMEIDASPRSAAAYIDGVCVAQSDAPRVTREVGRNIYEPVVYFPRSELIDCQLESSTKTTHCPLKGQATYYHVSVSGRKHEDAAWSYEDVLSFDSRLKGIEGLIGFSDSIANIVSSPIRTEKQLGAA